MFATSAQSMRDGHSIRQWTTRSGRGGMELARQQPTRGPLRGSIPHPAVAMEAVCEAHHVVAVEAVSELGFQFPAKRAG